MLVLDRKENDEVLIGDKIVITVIKTRKGGVRLGIQAPDDLLILRGEVLDFTEDDDEEVVESCLDKLTL